MKITYGIFGPIVKEREALRMAMISYIQSKAISKSSIAREIELSYPHFHRFLSDENHPVGPLALTRIKAYLNSKGAYNE